MRNLILASALVLCSTSAFALCGVGGSEHSVGDPAPGEPDGPAISKARFEESVEVNGLRDLVRRHGYCPAVYGPQTTLVDETCSTHGCDRTYETSMTYQHPATGDVRFVAAKTHVPAQAVGMGARGYLSVEPFDVAGLGEEATLDEAQSELTMAAMQTAGIKPDQILMGASTLIAGRLQCNRIVVPGAVARCQWTAGYAKIDVADPAAAESLHEMLADLGAWQKPILMGNSRTNAAMVRCTRIVYPGAKAKCSLVIED